VPCLLVGLGAAKAKDEQVAVGVCGSEALAVGGEFAVEHGSVTLALNLEEWVRDKTRGVQKTSRKVMERGWGGTSIETGEQNHYHRKP